MQLLKDEFFQFALWYALFWFMVGLIVGVIVGHRERRIDHRNNTTFIPTNRRAGSRFLR